MWSIRQYQAISSMFKITQFTQFTCLTKEWDVFVTSSLEMSGHRRPLPSLIVFFNMANTSSPSSNHSPWWSFGGTWADFWRLLCHIFAHITLGSFNTQGFLAVSWGNSDLVILVHKCSVCDSPSMIWFSHAQGPQTGRTVREVIIFVFWWIRFQSWIFSVFS